MDELRIRVVPTPWNKGKLVGQKRRSNSKKFGRSACGFKSIVERANWRCSILASTASCGLVTCSS